MSGHPEILEQLDDGILTVTFNRPSRKNALTTSMFDRVGALLVEAGDNPDVRVVVFTGSEDSFCAGADLSRDGGGDERKMHQIDRMRNVHKGALALYEFAKPTVAKVNGVAVGAGLNLALGCDLIYAAESARFSEIFVKRGLSLDWGGSWLLPRLVGLHKAKELALLGDIISASEAADIGLVNRVVPDGELDKTVDEVAARLAAGPPIAMATTKRLLNNSGALSMSQALEAESHGQTVNFSTADTGEAIAAFNEKREPNFKGY